MSPVDEAGWWQEPGVSPQQSWQEETANDEQRRPAQFLKQCDKVRIASNPMFPIMMIPK